MNLSDAITKVAKRAGVPESTAESVVKTFFEVCTEALVKGESVAVRRFGKFDLRLRRAMEKPNPLTGETMSIPGRLSVVFLPSQILRGRLNEED